MLSSTIALAGRAAVYRCDVGAIPGPDLRPTFGHVWLLPPRLRASYCLPHDKNPIPHRIRRTLRPPRRAKRGGLRNLSGFRFWVAQRFTAAIRR
jgi:hypothetical protein